MPQITKLRIVNFRYNDGKRLIADELFDFEREGKGPADVLINLANGGGKSVLVQLIMQPILPKAKVAGRRIESFFTRSSDHCFVVLEWFLEGSKNRLMTGIALSASDSRGDTDAERGFQIKYYTFLSTCANGQSGYDIVTLPLSKKENGAFVPAGFDEIRALTRRSNSGLERYASDDGVKWRERLAQYGIYHREWKIIENLNANEDGLSKFFSTLKTSDAVIDQLILPHIRERLQIGTSKDDSSLETMLLSYARQFSRQQESILERETLSGFSDRLKEAERQSAALWESSETLQARVGTLFAFVDALHHAAAQKQTALEQLRNRQQQLRDDIRQIGWERESAQFYQAEQEHQAQQQRFLRCEADRQAAEERLTAAKKRHTLWECARYFRQLKGIEAEIASVEQAIVDKERNAESAQSLANLKYSALVAIDRQLAQISPELEELRAKTAAGEAALSTLKTEQKKLNTKREQAAAARTRVYTLLDRQMADDDNDVETLGIDALRNLDQCYLEDDLLDWQASAKAQEQQTENAITALKANIDKLEARRDEIPQELAETNSKQTELQIALRDWTNRLDVYRKLEEQVGDICKAHSMDFSLRFTAQHRDYLAGQCDHTDASIRSTDRQLSAKEEAIAAVGRGTLHIPKTLLEFLNSTALPYTSFERYLLTQQKEGRLSGEQVGKLLERYPHAAYAVIMTESDFQTLMQEAEGKWLPALLPVLTHTDVDRMLRFDGDGPRSLAAYARTYFADCDSYARRLEQEREGLTAQRAMLSERREGLLTAAAVLQDFSVYEESWCHRAEAERTETERQINTLHERTTALNEELKYVRSAISDAQTQSEKLQEKKRHILESLRTFDKLCDGLEEEARLTQELTRCDRDLSDLIQKQAETERSVTEQQTRLDTLAQSRKELTALRDDLETGRGDVADAQTGELVEGDWQSLLSRYRTLLAAQNEELHRLSADRDRLRADRKRTQKELDRRHCAQAEYENLYHTEEQEDAATREVDHAETAAAQAREAYVEANRKYGYAASTLDSAKARLREYGGEALPQERVGTAFAHRLDAANDQLRQTEQQSRQISGESAALERALSRAKDAAESYTRPAEVPPLPLAEDFEGQLRGLKNDLREAGKRVADGTHQVRVCLQQMLDACGAVLPDVRLAVTGMQELLNSESVRGDRYFTLHEHITENIHLVSLRIAQIDTDLREFHRTKGDLIHQCVLQGKQLHEGLLQLSAHSKVRVQGRRQAMIHFNIPEQVDEAVAATNITAEIEQAARELADKLTEDNSRDAELNKATAKYVGSKHLLRKYINQDSIIMRAYKIDSNPGNSGYRTWEQTQVNNSGAEKFVVYFAVILSLLAYAGEEDSLDGRGMRRVLVLDNPFGPISSRHVLEPMFEIARNYRIQMICLSDISKSDIVSCFDMVIQAIIKTMALSGREQLTHKGNELIEHGFYSSEQINLY